MVTPPNLLAELRCPICDAAMKAGQPCAVCGAGASAAAGEAALPPGTLLQDGRWRITGVLGQGGFGITYRAEAGATHHMAAGLRIAAIKEFFPTGCRRVGL